MKAVILAGGHGTRISEESAIRPRPMIEIGHRPILWHIMGIYSHNGIHDFVVCLGYKDLINEYFANYFMSRSDVCFNFRNNHVEYLTNRCASETSCRWLIPAFLRYFSATPPRSAPRQRFDLVVNNLSAGPTSDPCCPFLQQNSISP